MFTTDNRTENFLTTLGTQFKYADGLRLPDDLAAAWDKENIGRPVDVREDAVVEYAALMNTGSAAPATILHRTPVGFRVLDGVQRLSAAILCGTTRFSAYVVSTESGDMLAAIRVLANARMQGRAEPAEWTRRRAIEVLVRDRGLSCDEVARMGGWRAADVRKIADALAMQQRITSIGGPELPDTVLTELSAYCSDDLMMRAPSPIAGFLNTLKQAKLSAEDAAPYIEDFFEPVRIANVHEALAARLRELHEDPEVRARVTGRQRMSLSRDVVLRRELKSAESVLDSILANGENVPNVDELYQIVERMKKKLQRTDRRKLRKD